jgi:hypothetical protein
VNRQILLFRTYSRQFLQFAGTSQPELAEISFREVAASCIRGLSLPRQPEIWGIRLHSSGMI